MSYAIVTAGNARYFCHVLALVTSCRAAAHPAVPAIYVLDVGLTARQVAALVPLVHRVLPARWEFPRPEGQPDWFRAMLVRPFLADYVEAETIVWIDGDAWVQSWSTVTDLVAAAATGRLAIVEESFGPGISLTVPDGRGGRKTVVISRELVAGDITAALRASYGDEAAHRFGAKPPFNCGVFALRAESPAWAVWQERMREGLARQANFYIDQNSLNLAIRTGQIEIRPMPASANYICVHQLPDYDCDRQRFTVPGSGEAIGILHLTDAKLCPTHPIVQRPSGETREMSLLYFDWLSLDG